MGRIRLWSVALKHYFFNPIKGLLWRPNLARTASAADQLVEYLSKETWHGVCGQRAAWVLVLVTRKRTASHLANYLSSSPQLQARGITSVCFEDQGSGSGEQGKDRIGSYLLFQKLIESFLRRPFKRMCSCGGTRAYLVKWVSCRLSTPGVRAQSDRKANQRLARTNQVKLCINGSRSHNFIPDLVAFEPGEVLRQICDGFVQVVVSTSAPEDTLGLPSCQLVVQMNPPSSTQALTQIRARSQAARFVCISRNEEQAKKIEDLLRREENMKRAVRILNG